MPDWSPPPIALHLVMPPGEPRPRRVTALMDYLGQALLFGTVGTISMRLPRPVRISQKFALPLCSALECQGRLRSNSSKMEPMSFRLFPFPSKHSWFRLLAPTHQSVRGLGSLIRRRSPRPPIVVRTVWKRSKGNELAQC